MFVSAQLAVAMKQAFDYCTDVINETRTSFSKGVRNDKKLFDSYAFREVWFNACLHNNWADGTPPAIYVYTDRMEIVSTGGLPANLSKEDFFKGISKPVNEELAKLFIRLDLMEQTGYGIPLVTKRYGKTVFEFLDFFLRVTIPFEFEIENNVTQNDTQGDTQNDTQGGTIDNWIEEQIRKNPKITTEELAKLSGKSVITIKRHITKLSHIKYVGSGYSGHWEIIK